MQTPRLGLPHHLTVVLSLMQRHLPKHLPVVSQMNLPVQLSIVMPLMMMPMAGLPV